ncbi:MAG: 16S rRNA (uracil(1498)-N(3))-methyltransferase [Candidatus Aminicenantes bacterium]|nr:16S rRNA (uracil(1498)-N(3))-methyltransferase [Candidatus Aminicenantes bacterium]
MRPRRFYSDKRSGSGHIEIVSEELFHLRKVLRSKPGDPVEVFNGKGTLFSGKIETIGNSRAVVKIEKETVREKPAVNIIISPSLLKKKPMNLMIEKLTEMGVDEIRPVIFSRTEAELGESSIKKWEKLAMESLKVNDKLWASRIYPPCTIEEIISRSENIKNKILLDIEGKRTYIKEKGPFLCIVGPPGDFTPEEREMFINSGFTPVNINESVMKVETAAFSAVSILKYLTR